MRSTTLSLARSVHRVVGDIPDDVGRFSKRVDAALPGNHTLQLYDKLSWREANVLAQLRMGISRLNGYLHYITATSQQCACRWVKETVEHFLFYCPKWTEQRAETLRSSEAQRGNLSFCLGGKSLSDDATWTLNMTAVRATNSICVTVDGCVHCQHHWERPKRSPWQWQHLPDVSRRRQTEAPHRGRHPERLGDFMTEASRDRWFDDGTDIFGRAKLLTTVESFAQLAVATAATGLYWQRQQVQLAPLQAATTAPIKDHFQKLPYRHALVMLTDLRASGLVLVRDAASQPHCCVHFWPRSATGCRHSIRDAASQPHCFVQFWLPAGAGCRQFMRDAASQPHCFVQFWPRFAADAASPLEMPPVNLTALSSSGCVLPRDAAKLREMPPSYTPFGMPPIDARGMPSTSRTCCSPAS
ncbi:hypothetical protein Purlil1_13858 [Purpureocillium lilacinum]|uniref:Reverse transcriptase n=1 Tax=Purpureocillium lilacinum TaxID=33203 RepID=A0ABR0BCY4_PURLI|nr:hypothetical protein Purlil1_13858 [Purpureocillium lilacinum]